MNIDVVRADRGWVAEGPTVDESLTSTVSLPLVRSSMIRLSIS